MPLNRPPLFQPLRFAVPATPITVAPEKSRADRIAEFAYFRAESRGFAPGHEVEDWLAAEADVDRLSAGTPPGEPLP